MSAIRKFICFVQTDGVALRRTIFKTGLKQVRQPTATVSEYVETPGEVAQYLLEVIQANDLIPVGDFDVYAATFVADITGNLENFIEEYDPNGGKNQFKVYFETNTDSGFVGVTAIANVIQFNNGESVGFGEIYLDGALAPVLDVAWSGTPEETVATVGSTFTMPTSEYPDFTDGTLSNTVWESSVTVDGVELFPGERKAFDFAYDIPEASTGQTLAFTAYATNLVGEDSITIEFVIAAAEPPPEL